MRDPEVLSKYKYPAASPAFVQRIRPIPPNAVKLLTLAAHVLGGVGLLLLQVDNPGIPPLVGGSPCENRLQPQFQNY